MKTIKYIAVLSGLVLFAGACTHKFNEYNDDPNRLPLWSISPAGLMEETIFKGAEGYMTRFYSLSGELIQFSATGTGSTAVHRYVISGSTVNGTWDHSATWAVNSDHMYKLALKQEDKNFQAIGLTLRALFMSNLTDIFGDIPFSEAFSLLDPETEDITKMTFDEQKDVYTQLLADLETANSLYDIATPMEQPAKDLLYKGDIAKWRKFTNSLYLRLLMRLSNRNAEMKVSVKIAEIFDNPSKYPVFETLADGAILEYTGITPLINTYGNSTVASWNGRSASKYIVTLLDECSDPRLGLYYKQSGQEWNGIESGMPSQDIDGSNLSRYNQSVLGQLTSPYSFMRYDEVLFIKAEAAYHGWIPGGQNLVKEIYNEAINQSVRYWDWVAGDFYTNLDVVIERFLGRVAYDGEYETLMTQKYVALFWCGFEAWHEYRRTELPKLKVGTDTQNNGILPRRLEYPLNTSETNRANYEKVIAKYVAKYGSGDNMMTPVWWSLNAVKSE